ncbi:MAG TPA: oligosaccharide flippase family protein [Acidobacteriaceae bacterium]|nr:oligosaccharide flippase family protein [Acidobacteriaceae bacterium]
MRRHLTNAGFGVVDYVSYPAGMLLVAPIVLHRLGSAEYGLWMIATAVISAGGILASGFCDACIQRVAAHRGSCAFDRMRDAVRSMLAINLVTGTLLGAAVWAGAPYAARHAGAAQTISPAECQAALRIASAAILVRAMESVGVGVQRAFERYRATVQISAATRLLTLASAAVLAMLGCRTAAILVATVVWLALGTIAQFRQAGKLIGNFGPRRGPESSETRALFGLGFFAWVQAAGGVVYAQLDRILLGISLGAATVTPYSLCVQFAHPVFGLTASGLNFLFPYLSGRAGALSASSLRVTLLKAFACNLALVVCGVGALLLIGDRLIRIWAGPAVAQRAAPILLPIVAGAALAGLGVTGTYALQALGQFRSVAWISLAGRGAMLLMMSELLRHRGVQGLALSRLFYGAVSLLVYIPLLQQLKPSRDAARMAAALPGPVSAQEGSNL